MMSNARPCPRNNIVDKLCTFIFTAKLCPIKQKTHNYHNISDKLIRKSECVFRNMGMDEKKWNV